MWLLSTIWAMCYSHWCLFVYSSSLGLFSTTQCSLTYIQRSYGKIFNLLKIISDSYGFTANVRFTYKCLISKDPGLTVVCTLTLSTLILAYILRIFEVEYYRSVNQIDFNSFFNSVWVIVITMTTVGFGDLVPYSFIGRLIIMITAFWGAFIISLVIVSVTKIFELNRNQKKAMHHLYLTRKAASSITSAMRYFMAKKRSKLTAFAAA